MAWVKIDDGFLTHPKALAAGKDGRALFIAGLCYCARELTDGHIATTMLAVICAAAEVKRSTAAVLERVGLWEPVDGGWQIHDWSEYQPSSWEVRELRRKRSEAGRRGGSKPTSKPTSQTQANRQADQQANGKQTDNPVPLTTTSTSPRDSSVRHPQPVDKVATQKPPYIANAEPTVAAMAARRARDQARIAADNAEPAAPTEQALAAIQAARQAKAHARGAPRNDHPPAA